MTRRGLGFTIIEVLITMVIAVALFTLGIVSVRTLQAQARDKERAADVAAIARALEQRYNRGNSLFVTDASYTSWVEAGTYPGTKEIQYANGTSVTEFNPDAPALSGVDGLIKAYGLQRAAVTPPQATAAITPVCTTCGSVAETQTQIDNAFKVASVWVDRYVYEPIDSAGAVCSSAPCVRFNLYWRGESDSTIYKVRSKRQ